MEKPAETLVTLRLYEAVQYEDTYRYYGIEQLSISIYSTEQRHRAQRHVLVTSGKYVLEMCGFEVAYSAGNLRRVTGLLKSINAIIAERFNLKGEV
jgi:uncharacterized protein YutD